MNNHIVIQEKQILAGYHISSSVPNLATHIKIIFSASPNISVCYALKFVINSSSVQNQNENGEIG